MECKQLRRLHQAIALTEVIQTFSGLLAFLLLCTLPSTCTIYAKVCAIYCTNKITMNIVGIVGCHVTCSASLNGMYIVIILKLFHFPPLPPVTAVLSRTRA